MRKWLVMARKMRGLSQKEVADAVEVAQPVYCRYETGERTPSVSTAKRIAAALGFDWTEFFSAEQRDAG